MLPNKIPEGQVFHYTDGIRPAQMADAFSLMEVASTVPFAILVHPDLVDSFVEWVGDAIDTSLERPKSVLCNRAFLPEPTKRVGLLWMAEIFPHPAMKPGMILVLGELPWTWVKGDPIDFNACIIFQRVCAACDGTGWVDHKDCEGNGCGTFNFDEGCDGGRSLCPDCNEA